MNSSFFRKLISGFSGFLQAPGRCPAAGKTVLLAGVLGFFVISGAPGPCLGQVSSGNGEAVRDEQKESREKLKNRVKVMKMMEARMKDLSGSLGRLPDPPALTQSSVIEIPALNQTIQLPESGAETTRDDSES